jgi:hypothetical protein
VIEALRSAKLESLREGDPPAVWAAFTVVGDPTVVVPLRPPRSSRLWWAGAAAVIAIAGAAGWRRRLASAAG